MRRCDRLYEPDVSTLFAADRCRVFHLKLQPKQALLHYYNSPSCLLLIQVSGNISITSYQDSWCRSLFLYLPAASWAAVTGEGKGTAAVMAFSQRATERRVVFLHGWGACRFRKAPPGIPIQINILTRGHLASTHGMRWRGEKRSVGYDFSKALHATLSLTGRNCLVPLCGPSFWNGPKSLYPPKIWSLKSFKPQQAQLLINALEMIKTVFFLLLLIHHNHLIPLNISISNIITLHVLQPLFLERKASILWNHPCHGSSDSLQKQRKWK